MRGDLLDLILLGLLVLAGISGYRRGLVSGVLAFAGLLVLGFLGAHYLPGLVAHFVHAPKGTTAADEAITRRVITLVLVAFVAAFGYSLGASVGERLRERVIPSRLRPVDGAGGAAASAVAFLVVAWLLALGAAYAPFPALARQVHRSMVLSVVDRAIPSSGQQAASSLLRAMQRHNFPAVTGPFATLLAPALPAPDTAVVPGAVRVARGSIVKITGDAPSCNRSIEGSGFAYATGRVMTNAHVVAGVRSPHVTVPGGTRLNARVVLYDPNRDVAVLAVPGLDSAALAFAPAARTGSSAVVAGYPENGPFTAVAARIALDGDVTGPNIYQTRTVTRQVYTVRADVRPGNSGGPLLDPRGHVLGVVFASSLDQADVGYALTAAEVDGDARAGRTATASVSTQGCD